MSRDQINTTPNISNEIAVLDREINDFGTWIQSLKNELDGEQPELLAILNNQFRQLKENTAFLNNLTPEAEITPFLVAFTDVDNLVIYIDRLDFILNNNPGIKSKQSQSRNWITSILKTFCNRISNCLWQIIQKMWTPTSWSISGSASLKVPFLSIVQI